MRQDQYERLQAIEEELLDVFFVEAKPADWPGHGKKLAELTQQERGDLYWIKKNAASSLALAQRVGVLIGRVQMSGAGTTPPAGPPDGDGMDGEAADATRSLDAEIATAEREAAALISGARSGALKERFDRHVHGKPAAN